MLHKDNLGRFLLLVGMCFWGLAFVMTAEAQSTASVNLPFYTVNSPNPMPGGQFGVEVCQDDNTLESYIGAPGERRVYRLENKVALEYLYQPTIDGFGQSISAANGVLLVGAPKSDLVVVIDGGMFTALTSPDNTGTFGRELLCHDMDGDGHVEIFISDPHADKVHIYNYPSLALVETLTNFETTPIGAFGHSLAAVRWDADSTYELAISAPGNTSAGVPLAGKVYIVSGAHAGVSNFIDEVEPPAPVVGDNPRFGMNIYGHGRQLGVGEPRLDTSVGESGSVYLFRQSGLVKQVILPDPIGEDLLGYRVMVGDFGLCGIALNAGPNEGLWFGLRHVALAPNSSHHWAQSADAQYLEGTTRQDIVTGDNSWGPTTNNFEGRVVVYFR